MMAQSEMPVVILAGGLGTRLTEETEVRPKPLVEIGAEPILWHIMSGYSHFGFNNFCVALGYKGNMIKRYFLDRCQLNGDITINMESGSSSCSRTSAERWTVRLIDTGSHTQTGGRLRRLAPFLSNKTFMLTYGDGVSDVNPNDILQFHRSHGRIATITAVRPPARFGGIIFDGLLVKEFTEKPQIGEGWINGGFMVFEPGVFRYLNDDTSVLEVSALERLAQDNQLAAYKHEGFWACMDTLRDKYLLKRLWDESRAPWKVWT